jgi:hypothetical protein
MEHLVCRTAENLLDSPPVAICSHHDVVMASARRLGQNSVSRAVHAGIRALDDRLDASA